MQTLLAHLPKRLVVAAKHLPSGQTFVLCDWVRDDKEEPSFAAQLTTPDGLRLAVFIRGFYNPRHEFNAPFVDGWFHVVCAVCHDVPGSPLGGASPSDFEWHLHATPKENPEAPTPIFWSMAGQHFHGAEIEQPSLEILVIRTPQAPPIRRGQLAFVSAEVCALLPGTGTAGLVAYADLQACPRGWGPSNELVRIITSGTAIESAERHAREVLAPGSRYNLFNRGDIGAKRWSEAGFGASGEQGRFGPFPGDVGVSAHLGGHLAFHRLIAHFLALSFEESRRPWGHAPIARETQDANAAYFFGNGVHSTSRWTDGRRWDYEHGWVPSVGPMDPFDGPNAEHFEVASLPLFEQTNHPFALYLAERAARACTNTLHTHGISNGGFFTGDFTTNRAVGRMLGTLRHFRSIWTRYRIDPAPYMEEFLSQGDQTNIAATRIFNFWIMPRNAKIPADFGRVPDRENEYVVGTERIVEVWQFFAWSWLFVSWSGNSYREELEIIKRQIGRILRAAIDLDRGIPKFALAANPSIGRDYSWAHEWLVPLIQGFISSSTQAEERSWWMKVREQIHTKAQYDAELPSSFSFPVMTRLTF